MCGDRVTGDLGDLGALTELRVLRLEHSAVSGHLGSLSGLLKLEVLSLGGCAHPQAKSITGNVASLVPCNLRLANLMETGVTGDVSSFVQAAELRWLFLMGSGVTGGLASLTELKHLQDVDVRRTSVQSNKEELESFEQEHLHCTVHHDWGYYTERDVSIDEFDDPEEYYRRFGNSSASRYSLGGRICFKAHADGIPGPFDFSPPLCERTIYRRSRVIIDSVAMHCDDCIRLRVA